MDGSLSNMSWGEAMEHILIDGLKPCHHEVLKEAEALILEWLTIMGNGRVIGLNFGHCYLIMKD